MLAGRPAQFGLLSLLPTLIVTNWLALRLLERPRLPWIWGRRGILLPLAGLTLLVLLGLELRLTWRTVVQVGGVGLTWFVYLFLLNERPGLTGPLGLVILVQGGVAIGQFLVQEDLGLQGLGELALDPAVSGVSVLWARGGRWLRAYGLTAHPNVLGATLAVLLLMLLQPLYEARGWRRAGLTLVGSVGILGLLCSFSRASWLAFFSGGVVWAAPIVKEFWVRRQARPPSTPPSGGDRGGRSLPLQFLIPALLAVGFLLLFHDMVLGRFVALDTPIEAHSLDERRRDADLALDLIADHPLRGVGAGNYLAAVRAVEPDSRPVHNVPLLVTAELGLPGATLWLWLAIAGLRGPRAAWAPWLALLVIGLFDNTLWLTTSWRAAVLLALLAAGAGRARDSSPAA
jgi:O-antigen ligase